MAETNGYTRFFPYDEPFDDQREAMDRVYNALVRGQDVCFEGACGTGKTLASLVPALEFAREEDKTVVISTNVHQQTRQFVHEASQITRQEPIRAVVFRGKGSMCHIDVDYEECQVLRDNTYDLVDAERDRQDLERRGEELLDQGQEGDARATEARSEVMQELDAMEEEIDALAERETCDHYYRNLTEDTDPFYEWLFDDVRMPDEIYEKAHQEGFCGYELLKDGVEGVDLAICNYHHLLDPGIREAFLRWLDRDPEDVIVVFDEAHNVEDAARDHATRTCSERTFERAIEECEDSDDPRADAAANVIEPFLAALRATYEDAVGFGGVDEHWEDVAVANDGKRDDVTLAFLQRYTGRGFDDDLEAARQLGRELDERYEEDYREGRADTRKESPTLSAATFLDRWLSEGSELGYHPVVSVRRDEATDEVYGRAELYTAIPREVTQELFGSTYANVLMSATLRPFDVLEDVLALEDTATMAYGLSFPEANRRTFAVDTPPLFSSDREDPDVQAEVAGALEDAIEFTPGNTLAFFPSYGEAERYHDLVDVDATTYLDRPATRADDLRDHFTADDHGVLFTSLWGTLTEGVSFDGDDAHTVAVVGVPYPYYDDRTQAVEEAYGRAFADRPVGDPGWRYAVEIPTIRKTRQALGRVIRSPEDVGVRVLLDRRYTAQGQADMGAYGVRDTFPAEEREELIDVDPGKLKFAMLNFYQDHGVYDGAPPRP